MMEKVYAVKQVYQVNALELLSAEVHRKNGEAE